MGVRTGTGTGRWLWRRLCRRRDAEERPELWPFLPVFPKLPLSLLVSRATLSHLLSRRSDKDKKTITESKRDKRREKTIKKYPLILLSHPLVVTVQ